MSRPCKYCGMTGHTISLCWSRPNRTLKRSTIKRIGRQGQKWLRTRSEWFKQNPTPLYICYICGESLTPKETTLDHVKSRSRHPELKYEFHNLQPCCWRCNKEKGSKDLEELTQGGAYVRE